MSFILLSWLAAVSSLHAADQFETPFHVKAAGEPISMRSTPAYAVPTVTDFDGDGLLDLVVGQSGLVTFYKNIGDKNKPAFAEGKLLQVDGKPILIYGHGCCNSASPQFVDLDNDGTKDLITGTLRGPFTKDEAIQILMENKGITVGGFIQILKGKGGLDFAPQKVLTNKDGKPLLLDVPAQDPDKLYYNNNFSTHQYLADLNADGINDIVIGGSKGNFFSFAGEKVNNQATFASQGHFLKDTNGELLAVDGKAAPHLADWDKDGDLDLLSGCSNGDISWAENVGSIKEPQWKPFQVLIAKTGTPKKQNVGQALIQRGPNSRVWVCDWNGDDTLDIVSGGDLVSAPAEKKRKAADKRVRQLKNELRAIPPGSDHERKYQEKQNQLKMARRHLETFLSSGRIWVYLGKPSANQ